jgi:methyl-accepting chemotaxis protein WspA
MKISLRKGILSLSIISTVLTAAIIILLTLFFQGRIIDSTEVEVNKRTLNSIKQLSRDLYTMCATIDQASALKLNSALKLYEEKVKNLGGFSINPNLKYNVHARDHFGDDMGNMTIPTLTLNGVPFANLTDMQQKAGLVDQLREIFPDTKFSIYEKLNIAGDMVCVSSNLEYKAGVRAVGTMITAIKKSGKASKIVQNITTGKNYHNVSVFFNQMYISLYVPIKNFNGDIIGMVHFADQLKNYTKLQSMVDGITVGETGYAILISGDSFTPGFCVVSKNSKANGKNLWNVRNSQGVYPVRNGIIHSKALAEKFGDSIYIDHYKWVNPSGEELQKAAYNIYYKPWEVMSCVTFYEVEMQRAVQSISSNFKNLTYLSLIVALILVALLVVLSILFTRSLVKPINHIKDLAIMMADGNIAEVNLQLKEIEHDETKIDYRNEIQTLEFSFSKMIGNLSKLIYQVHKSGIEVSSSTAQISASARELEAAVAENAASTKEVSATSKVIADSSEKLAQRAEGISDEISGTVELARGGQDNLQLMNNAMTSIVRAAGSISTNLNNINKKANDISGIIKTIDKISDNTTLLSLNAAIQAEKAGDQGKGFSVIARKINELADQTNIATKDIEFMVKQMQSSVAAGVMEMDKFGKEVQKNSDDIFKLGNHLAEIINRISGILPIIVDLKENMHYQANDANQISEAIEQLDTASRQTKEALQEFNKVAEKLNQSAQGLHTEVSVFKV